MLPKHVRQAKPGLPSRDRYGAVRPQSTHRCPGLRVTPDLLLDLPPHVRVTPWQPRALLIHGVIHGRLQIVDGPEVSRAAVAGPNPLTSRNFRMSAQPPRAPSAPATL